MSTVAFGYLTTKRLQSPPSGTDERSAPVVGSYVDIVAALVPAEVLAIQALLVSTISTKVGDATQITDIHTAQWGFWSLIGLTFLLFVAGRGSSPAAPFEWADIVRAFVGPSAFLAWTMLEPTSVWSAVAPDMTTGRRVLFGSVIAIALAAVTKALVRHAEPAREVAGQPAPGADLRPVPEHVDTLGTDGAGRRRISAEGANGVVAPARELIISGS